MRSRLEIKAIAKENMAKQRSVSILLLLLPFALGIAGGIVGAISARLFPPMVAMVYLAVFVISIIMSVAISGAFVKIYKGEQTSVGETASSCQDNLQRKLGGMLWVALWTFLWSLLFTVPGIVKAISYSMTPYILAEYPNVPAKDALKLSMRMTNGYKMDLFIAMLSFIGWFLLSALTVEILGIIFVYPYYCATMAGYYTELRGKALASGAITQQDLGIAPARLQ
ncbi:MAG: DUF975 family protein [Clostridiales bacterium]|jgi:uncharacterized membrane protein|nr:DUF975 family protein [Clostridiales bacterium]